MEKNLKNPLIIPVFLPHAGCRERCLFCNQKAVAGEVPSPFSVRDYVERAIRGFPAERNGREKQIGFYGGSFTALDLETQACYLGVVDSFVSSGLIDSVRVSTRPDALAGQALSLLKQHRVRTIEIGAQSMIDEVLFLSQRGHGAEDTISAVSRSRAMGFEVGLHLMIGLPGDREDRFLRTLDHIVELRPDFVRIHPTLVLRGSGLENLWREHKYSPLSLEEAVRWLAKGLLKLEKVSIPVARIGLQPAKELEDHILAGPYHPALRQLVDSAILFDRASRLLERFPKEPEPVFYCHPGEISSFRGQRNSNMVKLRELFGLREISVQGEEGMPKGALILRTRAGEISSFRKDL